MRLLFWDVDTQVDFMEPGGKLYVPGAEKIIPNVQRLNQWAASHQIQVVSSTDAHLPSDPEFRDYPLHCLAGTPGQQKVSGTTLTNHYVLPNRKVDLPADLAAYPQIIVEKQALDVFTNPNVEALLACLGKDREIVLYGVVTEICVDRAARGLLSRGYAVNVVEDAIRHLDEEKGRATVAEVQRRGGRVMSTEEVVKAAKQHRDSSLCSE
ncbi:MAG TPA: isochorismatase family cysteine hydrolase [Terriglobales bacterium]|nr:isochorismatase family cysteine hydrolase [Terriglobales bacterium]